MSLFSLGNIVYKNQARTGYDNDLIKNVFNYNIMKFPSDIGSMDKGHYMVIHINEQRKTQVDTGTGSETLDNPSVFSIRKLNNFGTEYGVIDKTLSEVDKIATEQMNKLPASQWNPNIPSTGVGLPTQSGSRMLRTIKRTKDTIVLYMPDTLNFMHQQQYNDINLGGTNQMAALASGLSISDQLIKSIKEAGSGFINQLGAAGVINMATNLSPFLSNFLKESGTLANVGFTAFMGMIQNPMIEMIYTTPTLRSFNFEFMIYPRSEQEAFEAQKILEVLRFHQAPEIANIANGYFLVPPSEFDIFFYYNGKENPNLPALSTCVLETIDIDYAPNGFAAYETQNDPDPKLGRTGMPVGIRLRLQFKETEIMTKAHYNREISMQNFSSNYVASDWTNE